LKLLIQPGDSVKPLLAGIAGAKKSIEIFIFRFDRGEVEQALIDAVKRGVFVHALIAYTNRGGEKKLRALEMRLLAAGVTVARTADDLVRYHGKIMIVDRRELYILAFNLTYQDIEQSRSFGLITEDRKFVQEAIKLFEADIKRLPYTPELANFVVSPANARTELSSFLRETKKELVIYDPKISDPAMIGILEERAKAGVDMKVIGQLTRKRNYIAARRLTKMRLHARTMIRDREWVFIGSQSLRAAELDTRREVGIIFRDPEIAGRVLAVFEEDWNRAQPLTGETTNAAPVEKLAKKAAKIVTKQLPPVAPVLKEIVKEVIGERADISLNPEELEETVKHVVKKAVREAVEETIEPIVERESSPEPR
jgi:cardiolipin synthase